MLESRPDSNCRALETELLHVPLLFSPFCSLFTFAENELWLFCSSHSCRTSDDCCQYVGVKDTIEQLMMVHNDECSCQIERYMHCSMSRYFSCEADTNVGGDRRQFCACRVFRPKAMLSRVEWDACQYLWRQELFQHFGRWVQ